MLLRNRLYSPYSVVGAFEGLTAATLDALPEAVLAYLASTAGGPLRRHRGLRDRDAARLRSALEGAVEVLPPGASMQDLVVRAAERGRAPGALPVAIVRSGAAVAVHVPHAAMDGRGAIEFFRFVVDRAAGADPALDTRRPLRLPYLRMLRSHLTRAAVRAYRQEQAGAIPGPRLDP